MLKPELEIRHIQGFEVGADKLRTYSNPGSLTKLVIAEVNGETVLEKEYNSLDSAYEVLWDLPDNSTLWIYLEEELSKWIEFRNNFSF
jgi:hypothetical protein